jgi:hypothetical protein
MRRQIRIGSHRHEQRLQPLQLVVGHALKVDRDDPLAQVLEVGELRVRQQLQPALQPCRARSLDRAR